jgi:hypothetical protein
MSNVVKIAAVILNVVLFAFWLILGQRVFSQFDPADAVTVVFYAVFLVTPALSIVALLWRPARQISSF